MSETEENLEQDHVKYPQPPGLASITVIRAGDPYNIFVLVFNADNPTELSYVPNCNSNEDNINFTNVESDDDLNRYLWVSPLLKDYQIGCGAYQDNSLEFRCKYDHTEEEPYWIKCTIPGNDSTFMGDGSNYKEYLIELENR